MTAGTAVTEAADLVGQSEGELVGVLVALDRQESVAPGRTAVMEMTQTLGAPVYSITTLADVIAYLDSRGGYADSLVRIRAYQQDYCVA